MGCTKDEIYSAIDGIIGRYGTLSFSELVKLVAQRLRELGCLVEEKDVEEVLDTCTGFIDPELCIAITLGE